MVGLVIKELPPELHEKLRAEAARNHRSMTRQAIHLLEQALNENAPLRRELPAPIKAKIPLTDDWLNWAKSEGRE